MVQGQRQFVAGIRVVNAADKQGQAGPLVVPTRVWCVAEVVIGGEADAHFDRELADQPLGNDLSLVLVQVARGKGLALGVLDFDTVVIDQMKVSAPTEVHAEQARQVLGQKRAGAAEAGDGDQGVISVCPPGGPGEGVERIDRVQAGVHR